MSAWLCAQLVFAALFLSSSALTPEECRPLVTPRSLADPSVMHGTVNFLAGYADHDIYKALLKVTDSSRVIIKPSPSGQAEVIMSQENRINGDCRSSSVNVTIQGDTASATMLNVTSEFHLLPSCSGCLVFSINATATNIGRLLQAMRVGAAEEEIRTRAVYLLGGESALKDSDLENFKQQASCLGFTGDPDFVYNPEKSFCKEGEGVPYV